MRAGVTGHQKRDGIDWDWVAHEIDSVFEQRPQIEVALSSLAEGADQVFARCAVRHGATLEAVIPVENYERFFEPSALVSFRSLLSVAVRTDLNLTGDPQNAFLQ